MIDSNLDTEKKKIPTWFILVLIFSTIIFLAFMMLMGAMLSTERG